MLYSDGKKGIAMHIELLPSKYSKRVTIHLSSLTKIFIRMNTSNS